MVAILMFAMTSAIVAMAMPSRNTEHSDEASSKQNQTPKPETPLSSPSMETAKPPMLPPKPKMSALESHDLWRKLWEDHIWWTRIVIISILDSLAQEETGNYTGRLLKNYEDVEDALRPFYGDKAEEFGDLVKDHLVIAAQILQEAKAGNNITSLLNQWYDNGNQLATKMNEMNPKFWQLAEAKEMWKVHLDLTLEEAVAHLGKRWAEEIAAFDKVHTAALRMADFFSTGIILQFPEMFTAIGPIARP